MKNTGPESMNVETIMIVCIGLILFVSLIFLLVSDSIKYDPPATEQEIQQAVDRANADAIMEAHRIEVWERRNDYEQRMVEFLAITNPSDQQRYAFITFANQHLEWMYLHGYVTAEDKHKMSTSLGAL